MRPYVIALNGPPRIGKGWLTQQIMPLIPYAVVPLHFASPIRESIMASHGFENTDEAYGWFKEQRFWVDDAGVEMTGREELILYSEAMKQKNLTVWCEKLGRHPAMNDNNAIVIIDDLGFDYEQKWLQENSNHFMTIVLAPIHYSIGHQWKGDSRFCLPPTNGYRAPDSNKALEIFKRRLDYAQPYTKGHINDWFSALVAGPLGEPTPS